MESALEAANSNDDPANKAKLLQCSVMDFQHVENLAEFDLVPLFGSLGIGEG